jgi:hypothetical protein
MTSVLYADTQAIYKNVVFTVARLKLLSEDHKFFLGFEGSDCLENFFGDICAHDHARNCDLKQLAEKAATGVLVNTLFQRNSRWDCGHWRLKLDSTKGVDHTNPKSWKGNISV